jgi:O-methyltransferase
MDINNIPDRNFYNPRFSPWLGYGDFGQLYKNLHGITLVSPDRCYVLYTLAKQALFLEGCWYETGVYKGGTAALFGKIVESHSIKNINIHLFDTFEGMPDTDPTIDIHKKGDFSDISLEMVKQNIKKIVHDPSFIQFHQGFIPDTFNGLENQLISFAHIDVDIYDSVINSCEFIYPRLVKGGFMVFDDYGFPTCPGARKAVDKYFGDKNVMPLVLHTGQAVVFKS